MTKTIPLFLSALALILSSISSNAALVAVSSEPSCTVGNRDFTVTIEGTGSFQECGLGNLDHNAELAYAPNWLSKTDGPDQQAGTITVDWGGYDTILLLLKAGNKSKDNIPGPDAIYDPDWVIFSLSGGDTSIAYSIVPGQANDLTGSGLSHFSVWGVGTPTVVPVPGTLVLFGFGLAGIGALRKKNRS